jgi:DNA-binding response OmpR family regulator
MRVLLVEDSERLQRSVGTGLRKSGFAVDIAGDGPTGLWMGKANEYEVIVLDIMLPGMDGMAVLRELRAAGRDAHVLMLTAKDAVEDRVRGLGAGADDYLVKPFAFEELVARVQALARRSHGAKNPVLTFGDLRLDTAQRTAAVGGRQVDLSPREYALLEYLALRRGSVVSRTEIEAHVYDERAEPMSNVVDATVYALRKKLDPGGNRPSLIRTRRGMGYELRADEPEAGAGPDAAEGEGAAGEARAAGEPSTGDAR